MRQREARGLEEVWSLNQDLDWKFWWICDLAVLVYWVRKWVHSGRKFGHTPCKGIEFCIIQKRRFHDRLRGFGEFLSLKDHLNWSCWWICDCAFLDGWISQESNWDFCARWKIDHILTFRFHYRPVLNGVLDVLEQLLHETIRDGVTRLVYNVLLKAIQALSLG